VSAVAAGRFPISVPTTARDGGNGSGKHNHPAQWVDDTSDRTLLLRRLDRLGRALERHHRDAEFHSKAFSVFMHTWLVHTRSVAPQDRAAALESAKKRYRELVQQVVEEFSDGSRFIDDLPQEPLANDAELDAVLAKADRGAKKETP
jgi:hypothetical protein